MRTIVVIFLVLGLLSCGKNDVNKAELPFGFTCEFSGEWFLYKTVKDERATVKSEGNGKFSLHTSVLGSFDRAYPCNLPDEFKVSELKIVFSGEVYDNPLMDLGSLPIVLTKVSVVK